MAAAWRLAGLCRRGSCRRRRSRRDPDQLGGRRRRRRALPRRFGAPLGFERMELPRGSGRTPVCILAYQPDGACHCLYDPGLAEPIELDPRQARARRRRRMGLSDDRTRPGDPDRSRGGSVGRQGRLGRQSRRASASRRSCIGHRRAGGYRRVQPWRGQIRRAKPAFRPARGSDLKSSLRRAVARASRFQKAVAKMSFQSSRSRRMTQPAPATRSWAASSRPRS